MVAAAMGVAVMLLTSLILPAYASNTTTILSKVMPGAEISYKQTYICETTPGVRSFSGYVSFPGSTLDGFSGAKNPNANIFFWYFESRNEPRSAPLSIFLGGGPGSTSLYGAVSENGPCTINRDSNSTTLNQWSWNNKVNMLYVDQPVHVGFSYDEIIPGILDFFTNAVTLETGDVSIPSNSNATFFMGLFPSQDPGNAVNTSMNAARVLWHFAQVWLQEFPEHNTTNEKLSIWGNSYGGHYAPVAMEHFHAQNQRLAAGKLDQTAVKSIELDTVGLTNACLDPKIEGPFYPEFAFNNTYGLQTIPEDLYRESRENITKQGGCFDQIDRCRALVRIYDPENIGANQTVNEVCAGATLYCFQHVQGAYVAASGRNPFDISREKHSIFPPNYMNGYFNSENIQSALGTPLNFTISSNDIQNTFFGITGDLVRTSVETLDKLIDAGVKVAMIHGDRDYRCNWLGGEALSLAITSPLTPSFRAAGYSNITTNTSYTGGVVRQVSKLSFTRIFEAGHGVGAYQPETVSKIFDRVMFDMDISTGLQHAEANYATKGADSVFNIRNKLPDSPKNECYLWGLSLVCTDEEVERVANGIAEFKDYILVN